MMKRLLLYIIILVSLTGKAQTFTGQVTDKSGQPLASASVVAKGDGGFFVGLSVTLWLGMTLGGGYSMT